MVTMGLTHNFQGMMAARFFLGVAEAGLFPGINYYLSCWYKRDEFGIRAAIFFSAAAVSVRTFRGEFFVFGHILGHVPCSGVQSNIDI